MQTSCKLQNYISLCCQSKQYTLNTTMCIIYFDFVLAIYIDAAVFFNQSTYSFNENDRIAEFLLVLSKPSSMNITLQVINDDITAVGK